MSDTISALKRKYPNDPRGEADLTLALGQWAESNGRSDIFESDPEFAAEYRTLRNDIRRSQDTRSTLAILRDAGIRGVQRARQTFNVLTDSGASQAQDIADAQRIIDERAPSPDTQEFSEEPDQGILGTIARVARRPIIAAETAIESLPQSALSLAGGAIGAGVGASEGLALGPGGGLVGGFIGAGGGSAITEAASKVLQVLQESGMDIRDPESIQRFFADESLMAKAKDMGMQRGIPVGLFDGATFALAGSFVKPLEAVRKAGGTVPFRQAAKAAAGELGIQMSGGMAGEYAGQLNSGEDYSGRDIAMEGLAEVASGPFEIYSNLRLAGREKPNAVAETPASNASRASIPERQIAAQISNPFAGLNEQPDVSGVTTPFDDRMSDPIARAAEAARNAVKSVEEAEKNQRAAQLLAEQQAEIERQISEEAAFRAGTENARQALLEQDIRDGLERAVAGVTQEYAPELMQPRQPVRAPVEPATPVETDPALAMVGATTPGRYEASLIQNPDAGLFDFQEPDASSPVDAYVSANRKSVTTTPVVETKPQATTAVAPAPQPIPSAPTLAPTEAIHAAKSIRSFDDIALPQADRVAEISDFVKDKTSEYSVAAIIRDNQTGNIYQRGVRRGRGSELTVEMAQSRKGATTTSGQRRAAEADLEFGTVNRPMNTMLAEKVGDSPRFSVLGYTVLDKPQQSAAVNFGNEVAYQNHPEVKRLVKSGYEQAVIPTRTTGRRPNSSKKTGVIEGAAKTGDVEVSSGLIPEVANSAATPTFSPVSAPMQMLESIAADVAKLGREEAIARTQKLLADLAKAKKVKGVELNQAVFRSAAEAMVDDATALTIRPSAANLIPDHQAGPLFTSALQSVRDTGGDVTIFEQNAASSIQAAQQGWGVITSAPTGQKLIALGVKSLAGRHDATVKLMHEVGHLVTDGLPEPVRRAFHLAIDRLHWSRQQWALNPLSTDLRILANADPKSLSPEQIRALASFTPEEITKARSTPREEIVREQAAEHLAMLGISKADAKGLLDRLIRIVKDVMLRVALAAQQAFKGADNVSPILAQAYVENQFLSFIHGDTRALGSIANWIGAPATAQQRVTAYESLSDGDYRAVRYDPVTREITAPDISTGESAALNDRLDYILAKAQQAAAGQSTDTALTRRGDAVDYTTSDQFNQDAAAINLQEEHLRQIFETKEVRSVLPAEEATFEAFLSETLGLPDSRVPATQRALQATRASTARDPLTNTPVNYDANINVDSLPAVTEGKGNKRISSAQDYAIRQTLRYLQEVEGRLQRKLAGMNEQLERLNRRAKKNTLSEDGRAELDELNSRKPLLEKIVAGDTGLRSRIRELQSKLGGTMSAVVTPGGSFPVPPSATATPEQVLANLVTIPKDLKFADRDAFFSHLVAIRDWLDVPANAKTGSVYGHMKDVLARLEDLAVTTDYVANTFRLRKTMSKSLSGKLRDIGTAVALRAARPFNIFQSHMNTFQNDAREMGVRWSGALDAFAKSMGETADEAFLDRHWNHLMRALESINESAADPFATTEAALSAIAGIEINTPARKAALRKLVLETRENERFFRNAFEQMGLKVRDKDLKDETGKPLLRDLIAQGYVTGRRSASRHLTSLYMRMNPVWSETVDAVGPDILPDNESGRTDRRFVSNAELLYKAARPTFDALAAKFFTPAVVRDFVEPLALNNAEHISVREDNNLERPAALSNVRRAWREAKGNVTTFAELLHKYEGLEAGKEASTVGSVIRSLGKMFEEVKRDAEDRIAAERDGVETTPRQMMDARLSANWPSEWVSYGTYDTHANLRLLHQFAVNAAFGRDGFGPSGEFSANINALDNELRDLQREEEGLRRDEQLDPKEVEKRMGKDRYRIALQAPEHLDMLGHLKEEAMKVATKTTGYLIGDFKLMNELVSFSAGMALQNPRSADLQIFDILAPFTKFKFSGPAFKASYMAGKSALSGLANSVLQSVGANYALNADAAARRHRNGYKDSEARISWRDHLADKGYRQNLAAPDKPETIPGRMSRQAIYWLRRLKDVTNIGPVAKEGQLALGPKLRVGMFGTVSEAVYGANIDALYDQFADLSTRGIEWLGRMAPEQRAKLLRDLESGVYVPIGRDLGYHRKWLVFNDEEALSWMKDALESKLYGERGLGQFIAKAWRQKEQGLPELTDHQFRQIANLAMTEWSLQSSIASSPSAFFTNPWMRIGTIFLRWPWDAMNRTAESFRDPRGRITQQTILDGSIAMLMGALPLTVAASLAFDWYDERVLGKKQNIRELTLDAKGATAALERFARYGGAGLASEVLNQIVNYDSAKNLSIDNRVFVVNQTRNLMDALSTIVQQEGTVTYGSVGRPLTQALGGSGVLHYLQIIDNLIPGVSNQDEAINRRINAGNYLRSAGRALDLDVRVFRGGQQVPTPITPWIQQMEMAAVAGDNELFATAWRKARAAAQGMNKEDPDKYVADAFADRHPLRRIFTHSPTTYEYRRILGQLDENGKKAVAEAINSYNQMLLRLGKPAYLGKAMATNDVDALVRKIEREASTH